MPRLCRLSCGKGYEAVLGAGPGPLQNRYRGSVVSDDVARAQSCSLTGLCFDTAYLPFPKGWGRAATTLLSGIPLLPNFR